VPLNRLGEEQAEDVRRTNKNITDETYSYIDAVNINSEIRALDPDIYKKIEEG